MAAFLPLAAAAQNLDPTVEVSRTYEGKLMEVHKPQLDMAVPDSVMRFDLDFDYSVTDKPYKGAYEFSPYSVELKPSAALREYNTLYLRAGAGYQLHPVFDVIWSPVISNAFRMNLYASHKSFIGNYRNMEAREDNGVTVLDHGEGKWNGYDFGTRAGIDGRLDWKSALLKFNAGYRGIQQKDTGIEGIVRSYNSFEAGLGLVSKKSSGLIYGVEASYGFAMDDFAYTGNGYKSQNVMELNVDASFAYALAKAGKIMMDVGVDWANIRGNRYCFGNDIDVVPHYMMELGKWSVDLGVRISPSMSNSRFTDDYGPDGQLVYPDVRVEFKAIRNAMKVYFDICGDAYLNSYSDLVGYNRRLTPDYCRGRWELMDVSEEKINASLGIEGRIGARFSYDFKGGYVKCKDAVMDGWVMEPAADGGKARLLPASGYGSYDKAYASLGWLLNMDSVRFDGAVEYAYTWLPNGREQESGLFMPAALTGDMAIEYNWRKRISVGVDCDFSTARKGHVSGYAADGELSKAAKIPGYADLGLDFGYTVNRKFSVWARGGNLLGMTIQRSILYAEKGPYFTAGICLNL